MAITFSIGVWRRCLLHAGGAKSCPSVAGYGAGTQAATRRQSRRKTDFVFFGGASNMEKTKTKIFIALAMQGTIE